MTEPLTEEEIAEIEKCEDMCHHCWPEYRNDEQERLIATIRSLQRTIATMQHPQYNELRAFAAEPNTSNQMTTEDVRKRLRLAPKAV